MRLPRSSGVLLHPTSLPSGRLDEDAYRFVDWLEAACQSWWQILPLSPPDEQGSPYTARSAFAASTDLLADPESAVSTREIDSFRRRTAFWIGGWERFAGPRAVDDQVRFEREWRALRMYARDRGVRIFGDLPIYVAAGSADHVSRPELFRTGLVAGAPPDAFSATGQLWGNPVYDWAALRREGYRWWTERYRRAFELVDLVRIDHFRGFVAYWAVSSRARTAENGSWRRGPGAAVFHAAEADLGPLAAVAEDLGHITEPVVRLRDELGFPGTLVLQLADGSPTSPHRLENHREWSVVYTGTHDHDTALGWWASLGPDARRATGLAGREPHWELIERALASPARLAVVQLQDVLGLGSEARMNVPGRASGNWRWRLEPGVLTPELARRLRDACVRARRPPHRRPSGTRRSSP